MPLKGTVPLSTLRETRPVPKDFDRRVREAIADYTLQELRRDLGMSQNDFAERLGMDGPRLSRIENREDHLVSTIRRYVEALGGKLEVAAVINGRRITLKGV